MHSRWQTLPSSSVPESTAKTANTFPHFTRVLDIVRVTVSPSTAFRSTMVRDDVGESLSCTAQVDLAGWALVGCSVLQCLRYCPWRVVVAGGHKYFVPLKHDQDPSGCFSTKPRSNQVRSPEGTPEPFTLAACPAETRVPDPGRLPATKPRVLPRNP